MKYVHLIGLVAMSLIAFAAPGDATVSVYHSTPGGENPGVPLALRNTASEAIELNVHGGNADTAEGTTACVNGDGDEVCGVDVTIGVTSGSILGFTVNPGISSQVVSHPPSPSNEIRIVAVLAVNPPGDTPPTTAPLHLGTLTVDATEPDVSVSVTSGEAVASNGDIVAVSQGTIAAAARDLDKDGTLDPEDNCWVVPNGPVIPGPGGHVQRDTDNDGYGNICDPDLNDDGTVNMLDLSLMKGVFNSADPDADLNGDGVVNFLDLSLLKGLFNKEPGPSGLGCKGTIPCPSP